MKITPIIKVVGMDCDLRCRYCYYDDPNRTNDGVVMDLSVIETLHKFLVQVTDVPRISLIWHGGEPTLAGIGYFEEVLAIQRRLVEGTKIRFVNKMQSNGVLIDEQWVSFLVENNFSLGISLDGPKNTHDAYRVSADGEGSFNRVMETINLCRDASLNFGCLAVLTDVSVGKAQEMFEFFVSAGIKRFRVKPCYETGPDSGELLPFSISPHEYGEFLIELFNAWVDYNDPEVSCGPVDDYLRGLLGKRARQCTFRRNCLQFWSVWPNGDVYQCEFSDHPDAYFGNLCVETPASILSRQQESNLVYQMMETRAGCSSCEWLDICRGGCSRYDVGLGRSANIFCQARHRVFDHIAVYLSHDS